MTNSFLKNKTIKSNNESYLVDDALDDLYDENKKWFNQPHIYKINRSENSLNIKVLSQLDWIMLKEVK